MLWIPFRRAFRNVIFRGGVEEFVTNTARWSHGINYLIILSIVLFITWPKEAFLNLRDPPLPYVATGGIALVMLAYINISQGSRKLLGEQYMSLREWLSLAPLKAATFVRGYVAAGFLECGFFLGLIAAATGVGGGCGRGVAGACCGRVVDCVDLRRDLPHCRGGAVVVPRAG
jgi:hypothetical protein